MARRYCISPKNFTLIIPIINSLHVNICFPCSKNVAHMTTFVFQYKYFQLKELKKKTL